MATDIIQTQKNWMKLSSIVDTACQRLDLSVNHYFQLLLGFGKWELVQLNLDRNNQVVTALLNISDNFTVQVPPDAIAVTKVGTPDGQFVRTISINDELSKIDRTPGIPEFSRSVSPSWLPNGVTIQSYGGASEFLNYGGRSIYAIDGSLPHEGHYQIVKRNGYQEILLDGNINATQLYIEYITLGLPPCGETILDPYIADYILKSILAIWETERNPRRTESSIARRERDKAYARSLISGRTNSLSVDDLLAITRRGYRLTNKT